MCRRARPSDRPRMGTRHDLTQSLIDRIEALAETLLGQPSSRSQIEWRWGRKGSMSLVVRGSRIGRWFDHEAGEGGGLLKLVQHVTGGDEAAALAWAQTWLGGATAPVSARSRQSLANLADTEQRRRKEAVEAADALWRSAGPITDLGAAYLARRGLPAQWSNAALRELSQSPYPVGPQTKVPALIFKARAAVQLVLLDPATAWKASVGPQGAAKITRGRPGEGGSVLQQGEPAAPTLIAEGPENGLTAALAMPTWRVIVTLGTSNLSKQAHLLGSGDVVLLSDGNAPTSQAAKALQKAADHYQSVGRRVRLATPPATDDKPEGDLNDALLALGLDAVRAALDGAPILLPPNKPRSIARQSEAERQTAIAAHREGLRQWAVNTAPGAIARATFRQQQAAAHEGIEADGAFAADKIPTAKRQATLALKDEIGRSLIDANAPRLVDASPAGVGKTITALQVIKESGLDRALVHVYEQTQEMAVEVQGKAAAMGLNAVVVRGRTAALDRAGKIRMCERHELVERAQAAGISDIQGTLCRTEDRICPHFHSCRYQAQRKDLAARAHGVVVLPHAYLTLPVAFLQAPDVVVIDESHHTQFAGRIRLDLTDITDAATNWQKAGISKASDWSALSSRIVAAFKSERPILAALRTAGINAGMLEAGREYLTEVEDEMAAGILPDMDTAMIERRLQEFRASTLVKVKSLIRALIDEIDLPRDESNGVVVATIKGLIRAYVHFRLDPVVPDNAALLILDASEDPMITRAIWGEMPRQAVEIERRANVTQIIGRSMSKTSLTGHGKANALGDARPISEKTVIDAERLQADICRKVAELPGKVLAIGQKDVVAGLTFRRPKGKPPVMKAHFNALRGLDGFKDFDSVAVVGRLLPPVWAMEAVARSLWATDPAPIITQADYSDQTVALTTRDGAKATVTEPTHPDPRVAAVLRQSLKAEVLQALDRLRLIHATTEKTVLIINEVALPGLVVDRVEQFRQWRADGSRIERALKTLDVIPLTAGKMVEIAGHIWESERSAERDLKALNDALDNTANLQEDNIQLDFGGIISDTENVRFQLVRYRHPGQRGRDCRALVRLGTRDVPGTLAAFVGPLSAIDVPGAPAIVHEIDIPPHVGGDLAERIAVMVIDGGLSEAAALATIRQEARAMSP